MTQPTPLTDRAALRRNRARAVRQGAETFLHDEAAAEIEERLGEVNKRFTAPAIVTGFPEAWSTILPGARIVEDTETLDLEPGAHDLVIHGLALHWANDPVGQLVQCRRALKPDGLFLGAMFGGRTLAELRAALAEAESRLTGGLSARVLPMGEIRDLGALLQRAGFALPVADAARKTVTYRTAFHLISDLRAMGEGNALSSRPRRAAPRALFPEAARIYAESYPAVDHRIAATFEMIFLTGWAPDPSQQQPLRPGSAASRLADALGATETPLGPFSKSGDH
ncbi:methyltransferase domain-containing protein [Defluviimonas sp. D31]|uniref:methyltransferase domain-containing protein n=1 Tax=Defluviimonas sp. D31 TaxID=3083253 RepID=UPI00296FAAD5|nr:methyltransferase domain-containing protein [Defluviimonas sp. D31]MDW4549198.1 methyltransferase domain-containing protein [Defluviimonas sp. D31]